jgi:hypothetical protein
MPESQRFALLPADMDTENAFELPCREVLSLVGPSLADGVLSYANAAQTNGPMSQGTTSTSNPLVSQGVSTVTSAAQSTPTAPNGATVQNFDSPNSSGIATINPG